MLRYFLSRFQMGYDIWVWVAVGQLDTIYCTPRLFKLDNLALLCFFFFGIYAEVPA
jgi:hypothetical protein